MTGNDNKPLIETPHMFMEIRDGVLIGTYKKGQIDLEQAKDIVLYRKVFTDYNDYPCLVIIDKLTKLSKEARDYLSGDEGVDGVLAGALVSHSKFATVIGNFFLKVTKPKIPSRLFNTESEALAWLHQYKEDSYVEQHQVASAG